MEEGRKSRSPTQRGRQSDIELDPPTREGSAYSLSILSLDQQAQTLFSCSDREHESPPSHRETVRGGKGKNLAYNSRMSTPSTTSEDEDWTPERKRVMQVNYYINGVGEENFIPAHITNEGTLKMKKLGYRTVRIRTLEEYRGHLDLAGQVFAGFLRGYPKESKMATFTTSALMCFETQKDVEVMTTSNGYGLNTLVALEILPILHLRKYQEFASLEELYKQMQIDLRCSQYLPTLSRAPAISNMTTTRCTGAGLSGCHAAACTNACTQTCKMCTIS